MKLSNVNGCCLLINEVFFLFTSNIPQSITEAKLLCKEMATAFIEAALPTFKSKMSYHTTCSLISPASAAVIVKCLLRLQEGALISKFLTTIPSISTSSSTYYNDTSSSSFLVNQPFIDELAAVGRSFGWETLCPSLTAMIQHARDNNACCDFLSKLLALADADVSTLGCKVLYKQLAIVLVKAL